MRVLLDTHVLLWATLSPASLSRKAAEIINDERNSVLVSAASAWEIATKVRLGKLPGTEMLERDFLRFMTEAGYDLLPIAVHTALRAGRLTGVHLDPFDSLLAAQALEADIPILSTDEQLDSFSIRRVW